MKFKKVSKDVFERELSFEIFDDVIDGAYDKIKMPKRSTAGSAGYDISTPIPVTLPPRSTFVIPTGVKVQIDAGHVMLLFIRSSVGIKKGIELATGVSVIDEDYYNNPDNEGQLFVALKNTNDYLISLNAGDRIAQGVFVKYGITEDDKAVGERTGGIGSTGVSE